MSAPAFAYRLQPPRMGAGLTAVLLSAAVLLFAPTVYWLTLPDQLRPAEPLVIGDVAVPMECTPTAGLLPSEGWYCGDTTVTVTETPGVADAELAARRALRNIAFGTDPAGPVALSGSALVLADAPTGAAALILPAPHEAPEENTAFVVTFEGADAASVLAPTWQAATGEALPATITDELAHIDSHDGFEPALPQAVNV